MPLVDWEIRAELANQHFGSNTTFELVANGEINWGACLTCHGTMGCKPITNSHKQPIIGNVSIMRMRCDNSALQTLHFYIWDELGLLLLGTGCGGRLGFVVLSKCLLRYAISPMELWFADLIAWRLGLTKNIQLPNTDNNRIVEYILTPTCRATSKTYMNSIVPLFFDNSTIILMQALRQLGLQGSRSIYG